MASKKMRSRPAQPKYKSAIKKEYGSNTTGGKQPGAAPETSRAHLGRTLNEKAHPSHPSVNFAAAHGTKHGAPVADKMLVGPKSSLMKKQRTDKKKAKG
jgi:hypothetical protein